MKKYFVVSDVHGFYDEMKKALDNAGFDITNPNHIFVSCGDLLDRGRQPKECLDFVLSIPKDRAILVRGNHEDLLGGILAGRKIDDYVDGSNGTIGTICDLTGENTFSVYTGVNKLKYDPVINEYFSRIVDFAETGHYIFTHAWLPYDGKEGWRTAPVKIWDAARWINPMQYAYAFGNHSGKVVISGHRHTSWGHARIYKDGEEFPNYRSTNPDHRRANFGPFVYPKENPILIAIDGCVAYTHKVNCYVVED